MQLIDITGGCIVQRTLTKLIQKKLAPRLKWLEKYEELGGEADMTDDRGVWRQLFGEAKNQYGFERSQE